MSLYHKTQEEIYSFLTTNYVISEEVKQKIKDELIDGEVLYELNDEDFKKLGFIGIQIDSIKYKIDKEKKEKSFEKTLMADLLKKLNLFGINNPNSYLKLNLEEMDLKIGQKILLKKYKKISDLQKININSNTEEISNFFRNNLQISEESINKLKYFTGKFIFEMDEEEISIFRFEKEDEKKIINLIKDIKNKNGIKKEKVINPENVPTDIEQKMKLEDMIIYEAQDKKITMKLLYEKLQIEKEKIFKQNDKNLLSQTNYYELFLAEQISAKFNKIQNNLFFNFSIGNIVENKLLIEPIQTKINMNNNCFDIDIISSNQIKFIIKEKKLINPIISCKKCEKLFNCDIYNLISHKVCQNTLIYEYYTFFELKTEEEFKNFFPKYGKNVFKNPKDFDSNFESYFNKNKYIKYNKKFEYYKDLEGRQLLSSKLIDNLFFGKFVVYYGFPGIGKSITALHTLKYEINHENIKTLYIHCKHLSLLDKEFKYFQIKNLLLYEIPFLFYNDFESYQECVELIKCFKFTIYTTYINLIDNIINYLIEKPYKYIIVFDQYNRAIDPEEKIKNIERTILKNENISNKFYFCYLMSLNNEDVKQIKIEKLLGTSINNQIEVHEVETIIYNKKFQNPQKNAIYNKVGKTIKNYIELYNIDNNDELNKYYKNKKKEIRKKLVKFYNGTDEYDDLNSEGINKLLDFCIDSPYTKANLSLILNSIHFKYFDIQEKGKNFIISYYYPAVEEVIKELYYSFFFNNKNIFEKLLSHRLIKGSGIGPCFEQIVISNLSPTPSSNNNKIPNLLINKKETIPYFVPRNNEVNIPYIEKKIKLEKNNIYLIEQEVFGGKSIDFIIIDFFGNEQIIYAFQISILKEEIIEEENIKDTLKKTNEYITENFFINLKVKEDKLYFGYIFSKINESKKEFKTMINSLKKSNIAYSYFDHKENTFYLFNKRKIKDIQEMVFNPFIQKPLLSFEKDVSKIKRYMSICKIPKYKIAEDIKEKIIKILEVIYRKKITILDFQECLNKEYLLLYIYDFYFTQDNEGNSFIVVFQNDKFNVYDLNNLTDNNIDNNYLLNDKCEYDCYFIYSDNERKKEPLYQNREKFLSEVKKPKEKSKKENTVQVKVSKK